MNYTRGQVIGYFALPQVIPRLKELFTSGFQFIPYYIALVYGAVRLLPPGHPYLNAANIGKYGFRHVIAEAANNLVLSWKNLDQIILFFTVLAGLVMFIAQFILLGMVLFVQPVMAGTFADYFVNPAAVPPDHDIAYMMLDMVFGVPNVFDSCISTSSCINSEGNAITTSGPVVSWGMEPSSFPMPIHLGLQNMFLTYSLGLLVVGLIIFIYFIITIVAETMQSGTPFGRRYNHVWAPLRMVAAFGLLMPMSYGLNGSQYIVLYAAKYGSAFATNAWVTFNSALLTASGGAWSNLAADADASAANMVATPKIPEIAGLLQFMYVAKACKYAEELKKPPSTVVPAVEMWLVKDPTAGSHALLVGNVGAAPNYQSAITFINGSPSVRIRFGRYDYYKNNKYLGHVRPVCGEVTWRLMDSRSPVGTQEPGVAALQELYFSIMREIWHTTDPTPINLSHDFINRNLQTRNDATYNPDLAKLDSTAGRTEINKYMGAIAAVLANPASAPTYSSAPYVTTGLPAGGAIQAMQTSGRFDMNTTLLEKGWAGSAIWYNRIAELNGAVSSALLNIPEPNLYPFIMEEIYKQKRKSKGDVDLNTRFEPVSAGGSPLKLKEPIDDQLAQGYWEAFNYWDESGATESPHSKTTGNAIYDIMNGLMGTDGLFNMRENVNVHPLAQLSGVGKALIEASMRNITVIAASGGSNLVLKQLNEFVGQLGDSVGNFFVTLTMLTLTAGFVLYYIVPFLPFIYFSFAFGGWVKGIFEAMVGAPLWALAHIRIDGHGLPGQAALSGYFLIFEIFLRPILMIAGLLGSISTFSALVYVLNTIFDLVVSNVGGFDVEEGLTTGATTTLNDMRGVVDEFFYTVVYVVVVYLMGMASFKMIDLVPNNILRWMGQSVTSFNDSQENAAESLTGRATQGAQQAGSAVGGGLKSMFR